jgi:Carboxypeptidase regulatory-like domain
VPQGHYRLLVDGLPKGVYVADVRQGPVSVFDSGFDVGVEPPAPIQVVLASNSGTVQGTVQDAAGKAVPGSTVVLVPVQHRRQNWLLYRTAVVDSSGHYAVHSIAPGDYTLFAWERVSPGAYYSARFLESYEGQGRTIRITPSSAASQVTVKIAGGR